MDYNIIEGASTASGTNTYAATLSVKVSALKTNGFYLITFANANTGESTLNINGIGAKAIKDDAGNALPAGAIRADVPYQIYYNGTEFIAIGTGTGIYGGSGSLTGDTIVTMETNNLQFDSTTTTGLLIIDAVNDRIGIANGLGNSPQYRFDVGENSYFVINGDFAHIIQHNSAASTFWSIAPRNGGDLDIAVTATDPRPSSGTIPASDNAISIKANKNVEFLGNIGIGTASPTRAKLVVIGGVNTDNGSYGFLNSGGNTGTAAGAVVTSIFADNRIVASEFNANSDIRIKENVHSYKDALEVIKSLNVVAYNKLTKTGNPMGELGLIAQELVEAFPLAVRVSSGDVPDENGGWKEVNDFHNVNYQTVFMLSIQAIQEQQKQIEKLKSLIN